MRGEPGRSVRTKTTPVDCGAGRKRNVTVEPVRKPTPRTTAGRVRVRCARWLCLLTISHPCYRGEPGGEGGPGPLPDEPAGVLPTRLPPLAAQTGSPAGRAGRVP